MPIQNQDQPTPAAPKPAKIKATYRLTIGKEYLYSLTAQFIEFYFTKNKTDTVVKSFVNNFFIKGIIGRSLPVLDIPFYINALNPSSLPSVIANQLSPGASQSFASHKKGILSYFNELLAIAVHSPAPTEVMTFADFAKHLGVSTQTANAILEEKKIPYYSLSSKKRMISVSDYNAFLASIKANPQGINASIDNPDADNAPTAGRRTAASSGQKTNFNPPKNPKWHEKDKPKNNGSQKQPFQNAKKPGGKSMDRDVKPEERRPIKPVKIESADSYSSEFGSSLKKKLEVQEDLPVIEPIDNGLTDTPPAEEVVKEPSSALGGGEDIKGAEKLQVPAEQPQNVELPEIVEPQETEKQPENAESAEVVKQPLTNEKAEEIKDEDEPVVEQARVVDNNSDGSTGEPQPDDKEAVSEPVSVLDSAPIPSPAEVKIAEVIKNDESEISAPEPDLPEIPQAVEEDNSLPTINIDLSHMSQALTEDKKQPSITQYQGMSSEEILKAQQKLNNTGEDTHIDNNITEIQTAEDVSKQRKRILIKTK